jgi:nitroimidazol reductase NimA-like FMN-containing flavoprotein (pyridoxamine 5'-phosphate oxidase superfamily)
MTQSPPTASQLPRTPRTRVTRHSDRQEDDRRALYEILDASVLAHVGMVREGYPIVLPMACARDGDSLLLHGSTGGGMLRAAAQGAELAVTVTQLDGLVYAASLFDSSMNYRSAMVLGRAVVVDGEAKLEALHVLSDHLMPGRRAEVRAITNRDLAATHLLRIPLEEASVKTRTGGPSADGAEGADAPWTGVLPVRTVYGEPEAAPHSPAGSAPSASVRRLVGRSMT